MAREVLNMTESIKGVGAVLIDHSRLSQKNLTPPPPFTHTRTHHTTHRAHTHIFTRHTQTPLHTHNTSCTHTRTQHPLYKHQTPCTHTHTTHQKPAWHEVSSSKGQTSNVAMYVCLPQAGGAGGTMLSQSGKLSREKSQ